MSYFELVTEREDIIPSLGDAGVLGGIRWAYTSAAGQVYSDYSEAAGHDSTWAGTTRFTYLRDRMDRVFACGRYAVPLGEDETLSLDVLHAELSERDIRTFPKLSPNLVERADLNGSPGWTWGKWRWLLASSAFGHIDELPWPQKSPTKQRVARQPDPDAASLFDELTEAEVPGLAELLDRAKMLDRETLVVAHSQDIDHDGRELVIGRPQLNFGGGRAWYWTHDLLAAPPTGGAQRVPTGVDPTPDGPNDVADAPVRLRGREESATRKRDADGQK